MNNKYRIGRKIVVVGTTGSGKTTFARELSGAIYIKHYELDALFWKLGWEESAPEEFRAKVKAATNESQWIIDGNYANNKDYFHLQIIYCTCFFSLYTTYTQKTKLNLLEKTAELQFLYYSAKAGIC